MSRLSTNQEVEKGDVKAPFRKKIKQVLRGSCVDVFVCVLM